MHRGKGISRMTQEAYTWTERRPKQQVELRSNFLINCESRDLEPRPHGSDTMSSLMHQPLEPEVRTDGKG